jgi:hypothetical protein
MTVILLWKEEVDRKWKTVREVIALFINTNVEPPLTIYPVVALLEHFQLTNFRKRAELQQEIFSTMANLKTNERLRYIKKAGLIFKKNRSPDQEKAVMRRRPIRFVRNPKLAADVVNRFKPTASQISNIIFKNSLRQRTGLAVLATVLVQYQFLLGLSMRAAKNDIIALWDFCEELRKAKIAKN